MAKDTYTSFKELKRREKLNRDYALWIGIADNRHGAPWRLD